MDKESYFADGGVEFGLVGIDYGLEIGLILIVFSIEVEDDFSQLRYFLAHLMV
jgi:hypothetical protein